MAKPGLCPGAPLPVWDLFHKDSSPTPSLGTMSVPQEEIQILGEWAMSVLPSLGLSLAASGGSSTLTKAVGFGAGGQTAPPGVLSGSFLKGLRNK